MSSGPIDEESVRCVIRFDDGTQQLERRVQRALDAVHLPHVSTEEGLVVRAPSEEAVTDALGSAVAEYLVQTRNDGQARRLWSLEVGVPSDPGGLWETRDCTVRPAGAGRTFVLHGPTLLGGFVANEVVARQLARNIDASPTGAPLPERRLRAAIFVTWERARAEFLSRKRVG